MAKTKLKLYWVETEDHDEDWFIIARSVRSAEITHEGHEGYDIGDAFAELVCIIPNDWQERADDQGDYPDDELLRACGGQMIVDLPKDRKHAALRKMMGSG